MTPAQAAKKKAQSWSGSTGQFQNKNVLQNGIDAINKAGASLKGFADGNKNDLTLVKNFYSEPNNNGVLNQYDMTTNLYLRYLSGKGGEGLEISPERTDQLRSAIQAQEKNLKDPLAIENIKASYGQGAVDRINKGEIPVYFQGSKDAVAPVKATVPRDLPGNNDLSLSVGSFWAKPDDKGGYTVTDTYDFRYAPKNKGGDGNQDIKKMAEKYYGGGGLFYYDPRNVAGRQAISGLGKPYTYTLEIPGVTK